MWFKNNLANLLTCFNLFCGCLALINVSEGNFEEAFYLVIIAGIFDFFDGMVARALKAKSNIGKDLDSLADVVTFGLLPGYIMFKLLTSENEVNPDFQITILPLSGFLITVCSAWRLAKFNNDSRQTNTFIGLPTPANGIFIASLGYLSETLQFNLSLWALFGITIFLSYLLVSELRLMALKFKSYGWKGNEIKYIFLLVSFILIIGIKILAVPFIFILYLILSQLDYLLSKSKNNTHHEIQS